ncbi:lipid II flippase MurJ [Actinoplanes sp. NPDC026619]|uniref:murein biosynthesis integral membrane protein MurJ n=1 Tax=Actinoplanes sp. NPDC026619 TaxID=3155798 RepID=UPI0033D158FE
MTVTLERPAESESPADAVGDSMTVAVWTAISRGTGVIRGVVIAAVLGATLFANTYQFTNSLPNLVFYGFLGGSMLSSLLIPALVRHVDGADRAGAERVAGGFLGIVALGAAVLTPVAIVVAPFALRGEQGRAATLLVIMLLPQIPLYGLVATAGAAMNSHGRFALAAAAPALENVGTVAVLASIALLYPGDKTSTGALLLLGLGTTGSVALHAAAQWYGARRAGVRLRPRKGWRDPEVRVVLKRALPSLAQAGLSALQLLILLIFANRVAGGVVAFQLAMNFYFLPIALGATPVALSLAPRLSRLHAAGNRVAFRDTLVNGLIFALFVAVPAAAGYLALREPIARSIAYGGFGTDAGTTLIATALGALALGVLGETAFLVATYACYAREDTRTPMYAMVAQLAVCLAGACVAPAMTGPAVLLVLGLSMSAGTLVGAAVLVRSLLRGLGPGTEPLARPVLRIIGVAALMAAPAYLTGRLISTVVPGGGGGVLAVVAASSLGVAVYVGVQARLGAPELDWILTSVRKKLPVRRRPPRRNAGLLTNLALLFAAAAIGGLAGFDPVYAAALLAAIGIGGCVYVWPATAAFLLVFLTPLTAGIDRGTLIPVLRPNEGLAALVGVALAARWLGTLRVGTFRLPKLDAIDWSLIGLAVFTSIVPLAMMAARGREIIADDLQYAIVLWKYLAVYFIIRFSITTRKQALHAAYLSIASACLVAIIGVLQSLGLFGVPKLLGLLYAPFGAERVLSIGRGSSTLALAAAVADLCIINLALAIGLLLHTTRHRAWLAAAVPICVFGALGAGEFSTVLGLLLAVGVVVLVSRAYKLVGYAVPLLLLGGVVMWPVIETRLLGFQSASGLPDSWIVRLRNLNTYFLPDLSAGHNWILGVRPSSRVPASHEEFGWVWIESGYIWLLWGGGIPLLTAYLCWVVICMRRGIAAARRATGIVAAVGLAVAAYVAANALLMLFDPHLTYRGAADCLLVLLAILRNLGVKDKP